MRKKKKPKKVKKTKKINSFFRTKPKSKAKAKSRAKKKPKTNTKSKITSEAKGLILLSLSALLCLSLVSYSHTVTNFLGGVGFATGWLLFALFGVGCYLIIPFLAYLGWQIISNKANFNSLQNTLYFTIFLFSVSILLNVLSENHALQMPWFQHQIFNEKIYSAVPFMHASTRSYLGGFPTYYLYKDLPVVSLENLFSSTGTLFLFTISALVSFLLLGGIKVVFALKSFFSFTKNLFLKLKPTKRDAKIKNTIPFDQLRENFLKGNFINHNNNQYKEKYKDKKPLISLPSLKREDKVIKKEPKPKIPVAPQINDHLPPQKTLSVKESLKGNYELPPLTMLTDPPKADMPSIKKELSDQAQVLEETLKSFGIEGKVVQINCGPTITSFEVQPAIGVKVQKIKALEKDIALNLQAKSIRIIAPIPGKAAVGVEIPSIHPQPVTLKELIAFYQTQKKRLSIPLLLGKTVSGEYVTTDLAKMPHLLIAGATGSGKSVCINTIVMSILMNLSPEDIRILMIDPKKVELTQYSNLPHMIAPVITESHGAYAALQWLVREMHHRYEIFKQLGLRNITSFNSRKINKSKEAELAFPIPEKLPLIVAIIDEFADLMMVSSSDLETPIARIAQMARAVGIHLILATQRPSREVITGIIKANFPTRIAFKVSSRINSQIIIDENGAESLLGNGDLLFSPPGSSHLLRAQGAYISDDDINEIISAICAKSSPSYLIPSFDALPKTENVNAKDRQGADVLYDQALLIVLQYKNASTTFLQRKLKIGYARAASLIDTLEENGVIGPSEGSRPRRILMEKDRDFAEEENS